MKDAKSRLRQQVRSTLTSMTPEELRTSDDALFARFLALPQVKKAKTIFAFLGLHRSAYGKTMTAKTAAAIPEALKHIMSFTAMHLPGQRAGMLTILRRSFIGCLRLLRHGLISFPAGGTQSFPNMTELT